MTTRRRFLQNMTLTCQLYFLTYFYKFYKIKNTYLKINYNFTLYL